jgi:hypothetical protein
VVLLFVRAEIPQTKYTNEFMATLMETPTLIRNVAVVGGLHHGKTLLLDLLIQQTHVSPPCKSIRCLVTGAIVQLVCRMPLDRTHHDIKMSKHIGWDTCSA